MAITENLFVGDGTTVLYSFTFPYLDTTHIKASLDGVATTAYTLANATTLQFDAAPANGVAIRIYRASSDDGLETTFFPGSAIRAQDLNDNFTQNLYLTQESVRDVSGAVTAANTATAAANTAISTANTALTTANSSISDSATALANSNTALSNSATAISDAAAATSSASTAVTTANAALAAVSEALDYSTVANVAAIPGSPADGDAVRVLDATGIEGFTPLAGLPPGFVGDSGLSVELYYTATGSTWNWTRYFPSDPDSRYTSDVTSLKVSDIGVTVQGYDATILKSADIGTTVQGYDANLATIPAGNTILVDGDVGSVIQAYDADTAKLDVAQSFTAQQTFAEVKETVYTLATTGSIALDPANGSIQSSVLTGAPTFTDSLEAGQSIVLMLEGGDTYSVTWPTITWASSGGNVAPTLTAKDTVFLWKVSTTLYGAYIGSYV